MTLFQVMFSRCIVGLDRANHKDRLALFQFSDEAISDYCVNGSDQPNPILDRLIEQLPNNRDIKPQDDNDSDIDEDAIAEQVKELTLGQAPGSNIDPGRLFVSLLNTVNTLLIH